MSERLTPDIGLPFPIEFLIRGTPVSHQSKNPKGREVWRQKVKEIASAHVNSLIDFFLLDERPLAATIFYFPPAEMQGDVDNIVKLIMDGMLFVTYPNDRFVERVTVQKFEPGVEAVFQSLTPTLERAIETEPPVVYIRADDDLGWRQVP